MSRGPLGELEDLWIVLAWIIRMRWALCIAMFLIACGYELIGGFAIPYRRVLAIGAFAFGVNRVYGVLLRRWRNSGPDVAQKLWRLACVQIGVDFMMLTVLMKFTGGMSSPLWFLYVPDLMATIFFTRGAMTGVFAFSALAMFSLMGVVDGHFNGAAALQVGSIGGLVTLISFYISGYFANVHHSALRSAKLRADKEAAEALSQRKDEVLSLVSHELNNPIMALRWAIQAAHKSREKGGPMLDKMFQRVDSQAKRLTRIVGDLYDVASVENGRLRIQPRQCEIMSVITEAVEPIRELYPEMEIVVDGPEHLSAYWDVERIEQLLSNLLVNAAKYAGPSARVNIGVRTSGDDAVSIEVRDDGPGIPGDRLPHIFEPFQRFDARGVSRGLGLGLALARQIAELHAGSIWAESVVGQGTTFVVRLPAEGEIQSRRRLSSPPSRWPEAVSP
jgi:signal transduction histidine kinase